MASMKQKLEQAALELAAAKQRLKDANDNWDLLYKQATSVSRTKKEANATTPASQDLSVSGASTDRIAAVLVSDSDKEWRYEQIAQKLPDVPVASIRALLFKLQKDGKAQKAGRGKWKAVT